MSNDQVRRRLLRLITHISHIMQSLAKNFGVSPQIVSELKLQTPAASAESEDLAVGSGGLSSGRDRDVTEETQPRDISMWVKAEVQSPIPGYSDAKARKITLWLPKNRDYTNYIVNVYFEKLNLHRPVFNRPFFEHIVNQLYNGQPVTHDPGFICSMYIVFALGTMSELNRAAATSKEDISRNPLAKKKLLPQGWPEYEEFFKRALTVKPDLRVTTSSLQALILLHWYLYTEVCRPSPNFR